MNVESFAQALAVILTPLITLFGLASRQRRLRSSIKDNLALLAEIQDSPIISQHTPSVGWMAGKIAVDVAKLSGQPLGTPKKPINWGSLILALFLGAGFTGWTYWIARNGFVWYSVIPGIIAALMLISVMGMITNRQLPPEQSELPPGAVPVKSDTASERIATQATLAAMGESSDLRYEAGGQADVALSFVQRLANAEYETALELVDPDWLLSRVQSWLWNNRDHFSDDIGQLTQMAHTLVTDHSPVEVWSDFVAAESGQFVDAWGGLEVNNLGVASRRRIIAPGVELVVLAPTGTTGGFFVTTATALPNALVITVRRHDNKWLVASHLGAAPPTPGWPPSWWAPGSASDSP